MMPTSTLVSMDIDWRRIIPGVILPPGKIIDRVLVESISKEPVTGWDLVHEQPQPMSVREFSYMLM
jgi:hypothetical protein